MFLMISKGNLTVLHSLRLSGSLILLPDSAAGLYQKMKTILNEMDELKIELLNTMSQAIEDKDGDNENTNSINGASTATKKTM